MSAHRLISAFNAGEFSPLLDGRADVEKHSMGCRLLENFIPRIYGGAFRRPGFQYIGTARDSSSETRLIPFNFSTTTNYVIEMGDKNLRIWGDGKLVPKYAGTEFPLTIAHQYAAADLFEIQFAQVNDVIYLAHPDYPPSRIIREGEIDWKWEVIEWDWPCMGDSVGGFNEFNTLTIKEGGAGGSDAHPWEKGDRIWLEVYGGEPYMADFGPGQHIQIVQRRENAFVELDLTADGTSGDVEILGKWDLFTYGDWAGTLHVERQDAGGNWEVVRSFSGNKDRNIVSNGSNDESRAMRLRFDEDAAEGSNPPRAVLEAADARIYGLVKVDAYFFNNPIGSGRFYAEVIEPPLGPGTTLDWSIEAWGPNLGYPRTLTFHDQRLIFGSTRSQPSKIWGSKIGDIHDFQRNTLDDAAYAFQIAAQEANPVQWIASSQGDLVIGTAGEEWIMTGEKEEAVTPTNVKLQRQTRYGSAHQQAQVISDTILYMQRGARKMRQFVFAFERDGYVSPDLTLLAEHVTRSGVKQFAYQAQPDPVIWCVTNDGQLVSATFERDQNVVGWSRHPTDGTVESVTVVYGDETEADQVWIAVKRWSENKSTGEVQDYRFIERLDPTAWIKLENDELYADQMIYLDSSVLTETFEHDKTLVTGLDHLEGRTVQILADGMTHPERKVVDGKITLDQAAEKVVVGLPYTSRLQPNKTEVPLQDGTSQGRSFLCRRATIRLWKTLGIQYADHPEGERFDVTSRQAPTPMNIAQELETGERDIVNQGSHRDSLDFTLFQDRPLPANILAMIPKFDVYGD